jgi:DNA-binding CsgD family transcriptional regulator
VGRRDELATLRSRLAEAGAGQGGVVVLAGEAGIGKTRLAHEFAQGAVRAGAAVLWGCCFEGDWQPAYGPWAEALGAYAASLPAATLAGQLGPGAAPVARLVPAVRAALPDLPTPSLLGPDEERVRLHDALIRFLLAASALRPLVLVLDDLHWADPDSLRLLRHAARFLGRARALVVGAYRDPEAGLTDDHPLMDTLSVLRREGGYTRVALRGFGHDETAEYLAGAAGEPLPGALVRAIGEETGGNPFYAGEVFRHLAEEAKVVRRDGRWWTDRSVHELGIPEGVRRVVGRRVARLSAPTGALLRQAAGFTAGFAFDVLGALTGLPEPALLDCLDEALRAGLLRVDGRAPPRYAFAHAIVRHALYGGLNPDRRARLHRRIALALEQVHRTGGGDREPEHAAELAAQYHASAAMPGAERGIPYALRAAERADEAYAHARSAGFLRVARDLAAEGPAAERADILCRLAIAEAEAVELERAEHSVTQALDAMDAASAAPRRCAEFLAVVVRALKDGGASATVWEPLLERGLALTAGPQDLLWARLALLRDRFAFLRSGPIGGALWLGSDPEAVLVARAEGGEEEYARTLNPLDFRTREETEAVLALARSWSRPVAVMRALEVAGRDLLYRHGAFREAIAVHEELLAVSERCGSIPGQGEALAQLTRGHAVVGDLARARETLLRAREVVSRLGPGHRMHRFVPMTRSVTLSYFLDGDWTALAAEAGGYAAGAAAARRPLGLVAAAVAALAASRVGKAADARALLGHVTSLAEGVPPTTYAQNVVVGFAALAVWELEAAEYARSHRRLALDLLRAGIGDTGAGPLELFVARMATLLGDVDEAQDYFERARRKLDADGRTHVRAILDYDQARALIRAGVVDRARIAALLDAALEGFHAHGMLGWAARAAGRRAELVRAATAAPDPPGGAPRRQPSGLTAREEEVLRLVARGRTNREIAADLVVTVPTVERHVANIYAKIGAGRRYDAIAFARDHGLAPA